MFTRPLSHGRARQPPEALAEVLQVIQGSEGKDRRGGRDDQRSCASPWPAPVEGTNEDDRHRHQRRDRKLEDVRLRALVRFGGDGQISPVTTVASRAETAPDVVWDGITRPETLTDERCAARDRLADAAAK